MPLAAKKKAGPDRDALYVAWDSAWLPHAGDVVVKMGQKLRGDHPAVQAAPWLFLPADTPDDEIHQHRQREYAEATSKSLPSALKKSEFEAEVVEQPEPLRDEDAVVAIRTTGLTADVNGPAIDPTGQLRTVHAGHKLRRDDPLVKRDRDAFVDVCNGVPRDRATVALQYMSSLDSEGKLVREVYAGQWVDKDDELARINPHMFRRVGFE